MLTMEKLCKLAQESFDNGEWICMLSGEAFTITKFNSQEEVEIFLSDMEDYADEDGNNVVWDKHSDDLYTDVSYAKDWNYFKNTMLV